MRMAIIGGLAFAAGCLGIASSLFAQQSPAGGSWVHLVSEDKFSGAKSDVFRIVGRERIADGILSGFPVFDIMCAKGKLVDAYLAIPFMLGAPNGIIDGTHAVRTRHDDKTDRGFRYWHMGPDHKNLFADRGSIKEFLNASDVRLAFADLNGYDQVALFSPSGIDRAMLNAACGEKTFR
jgi:hypothetical protein